MSEALSFTEAYPCVMGSNSAKMQSERLRIEAQTSDSSIGPANPNGLPSGKRRKRKKKWGRWSQTASESIVATETFFFASLQISLRERACEFSAPAQ